MRLSSRTRRRILISLTPMIDVVFIMLIFYMVAGRPTLPDPFEIDPAPMKTRAAEPWHEADEPEIDRSADDDMDDLDGA